jgi:DNA-binding helix-hairpin-helix protein with protein kinase domain
VFQLDTARLNTLVRKTALLANELVPYEREGLPSIDSITADPAPINPREHRLLSRILGSITGLGALLMIGGLRVKFLGIFGLVVAIAFGLWWTIHTKTSPLGKERRRRNRILASANAALWELEDDWIIESNGYLTQGDGIRNRIDSLRNQAEHLQNSYSSERRQLESNREALARDEHLRSQFIIDADINGIGKAGKQTQRKQTLANNNIETAFDISRDRILQIKGFGDALTNSLLAWRQQVLTEFKFDSKSGVPEADLRELVRKYVKLQTDLFTEIDQNVLFLENLIRKLGSRGQEITPTLIATFREWAQAQADAEECS